MRLSALILFALPLLASCVTRDRDGNTPRLSCDERASLRDVLARMSFDPTGCQWVSYSVAVHGPWGDCSTVTMHGWLKNQGNAAVLLDYDGTPCPAASDLAPADFVAYCENLYGQRLAVINEPGGGTGISDTKLFAPPPGLLRACWLMALGHEKQASRELRLATHSGDLAGQASRLHSCLAWRQYAAAVHAYAQRADEEAMRRARIFRDKYRRFEGDFGSYIFAIVAELDRRAARARHGGIPTTTPNEFSGLPVAEQTRWLIEQLDEVDQPQRRQPGWIDFLKDWRIKALVEIGDAAIPALLQCARTDKRMTRSIYFHRDFDRKRYVAEVYMAADAALQAILYRRN